MTTRPMQVADYQQRLINQVATQVCHASQSLAMSALLGHTGWCAGGANVFMNNSVLLPSSARVGAIVTVLAVKGEKGSQYDLLDVQVSALGVPDRRLYVRANSDSLEEPDGVEEGGELDSADGVPLTAADVTYVFRSLMPAAQFMPPMTQK